MRTAMALLLLLGSGAASAQNSILGVRGIGFPGRVSSAASRGMAGADQLVDPLSALNPAAVALFSTATAGITVSGGYRSYDLGPQSVSGLRETRFPVVAAGGRLSSRLGFGFALSTYAERTWDLTATDTITLRGAPVEVTDRLRSLGSIADAAGLFSVRLAPQVALGVGLHAITGSTRLDARGVVSGYRDPEEQQVAFEKFTDAIKEKAALGILFQLMDTWGYRKNIQFTQRGDESLYPWELSLKQ